MILKPLLGALALTLAGAGTLSAAVLTFEHKQSGSDVVLTTTGTLSDPTPWTIDVSALVPSTPEGQMISGLGFLGVFSGDYDVYMGSFPAPDAFGTDYIGAATAVSVSGGTVVVFLPASLLGLPSGYAWGTPLSNTATFIGASFDSLGVTDGSYYSWLVGNDEIELKIGDASAVPETGTTLAGLALAMAGLVTLRQRAGRRGGAQG